jgi:phosphopantetheinyl transferase (holo-ACP synthase)
MTKIFWRSLLLFLAIVVWFSESGFAVKSSIVANKDLSDDEVLVHQYSVIGGAHLAIVFEGKESFLKNLFCCCCSGTWAKGFDLVVDQEKTPEIRVWEKKQCNSSVGKYRVIKTWTIPESKAMKVIEKYVKHKANSYTLCWENCAKFAEDILEDCEIRSGNYVPRIAELKKIAIKHPNYVNDAAVYKEYRGIQ